MVNNSYLLTISYLYIQVEKITGIRYFPVVFTFYQISRFVQIGENHTSGYIDFGKVTKNVTLVEYYVIIYIGDTKDYIKQGDPEIESQSVGDRD